MLFYISGDEGKIVEDSEYPNVMFLMHKWFLASEELAEAFVDLYPFFDEKKKQNKKQRERNRVPADKKKQQQLSVESFYPLTDKFGGYSCPSIHLSMCVNPDFDPNVEGRFPRPIKATVMILGIHLRLGMTT